jgi:signal transduction histidine kinase
LAEGMNPPREGAPRTEGAGRKEVSCLALTFFYDYLAAHGKSRLVVQEGLPYTPQFLDDRLNWIDYATFLEIERRVAAQFPDDPDLFVKIGLSLGTTGGLGFIRVILRAVISPFAAYSWIPILVKRFLFPFVTVKFEQTGPSSVRGTYVFDQNYPPSESFFDTVHGMLISVPHMLGAPPARITRNRISTHEMHFDIQVAQWAGLGQRIRGWLGWVMTVLRLRRQNMQEAAAELEYANRLLQEKVDALTEAKAQLDRRVRDLTLLNTLGRTATSELDLKRTLRIAAQVISEGLDGCPVSILIAEGSPPGLVAATYLPVDPQQASTLRTLSHPDNPWTQALLHRRESVRLPVAGQAWTAVPLQSRQRTVGALLLGLDAGQPQDQGLLESLASQLAIAVENAISYRLIAELRDTLEMRVEERTAELEEARTKLEDTVARLEQADRAKANFFTNVNHELRTPLTLILAPLDDLEVQLAEAPAEVTDQLRHIRRNAAHLLHLVNEILDFSKLDAGGMKIEPQDIDLAEIVDDVVATLHPLATRKQLTVIWEPPSLGVPVSGDPRLLRRVVVNLLGNAVKYTRARDSIVVRVRGEQEAAVVEVEDSGPGIRVEDQGHIFERFHRAADADVRAEGSGIGLAMAHDIVQLHAGTIELVSEPEQGCLFRVRLPRGSATMTTARVERRAQERPVTDAVDLDAAHLLGPAVWEAPERPSPQDREISTRVLLVEDNPEMRDFLHRMLVRQHNVLLAEDGVRGLELAAAELPDVVVSDVMMPRMDGYTLCRRLKDSPMTRNIPVILVSARHGTDAALEGFAAGADDFVTKPFSPPELLARVNAQIRIRTLAVTLIRLEKQSSLGVLAAGIAHELLNPVNAIINAVPSIRKSLDRIKAGQATTRDPDMVNALLDAVEASGGRMHGVVRGVLTYSRQERVPRLAESPLSTEIESVLSILRFRLDQGFTVHRAYGFDEPVAHYGEWIGQAVMNLVGNALDAMQGNGGKNIWIRTEKDGNRVRIRIRDEGPGVPAPLREKIFDAFYTTKPPGTGTGMGLAISREIIEMHRGTLELNTAVTTGAEFVISLPIASEGLVRVADPSPRARHEPAEVAAEVR